MSRIYVVFTFYPVHFLLSIPTDYLGEFTSLEEYVGIFYKRIGLKGIVLETAISKCTNLERFYLWPVNMKMDLLSVNIKMNL